ncbi:hypothetical protein [Pseudacidovorax sp. 1753]|uniref:hypothetical protein n=1 Tax=Pseudacidovorax sp. 1753 TaxID=3156419 RepID=UPI003394DC9B
MDPIARLRELALALSDRHGNFGADEVLPYAAEAIALVRSHPERLAEFEQEFVCLPGHAPPEFIEVCMHALRLPGVRAAFERERRAAIAANDWRREPAFRHYLMAFEDDWEDAVDFYSEYFGKPNVR